MHLTYQISHPEIEKWPVLYRQLIQIRRDPNASIGMATSPQVATIRRLARERDAAGGNDIEAAAFAGFDLHVLVDGTCLAERGDARIALGADAAGWTPHGTAEEFRTFEGAFDWLIENSSDSDDV